MAPKFCPFVVPNSLPANEKLEARELEPRAPESNQRRTDGSFSRVALRGSGRSGGRAVLGKRVEPEESTQVESDEGTWQAFRTWRGRRGGDHRTVLVVRSGTSSERERELRCSSEICRRGAEALHREGEEATSVSPGTVRGMVERKRQSNFGMRCQEFPRAGSVGGHKGPGSCQT